MRNLSKETAFQNLVAGFGRKPGSHLFPLFNYFFVPQTVSQLKAWKRSIKKGVSKQDLLFNISDFDLVKDFSPNCTMKLTKSKKMCRIDLKVLVKDVEEFLLSVNK